MTYLLSVRDADTERCGQPPRKGGCHLNIQAFCDAVEADDIETVRRLAAARPELVSLSTDGVHGEKIALHWAVFNRKGEMTRALMELGSDARKGFWPHRSATSAYTIAKDRGYAEIVAIIEHEEASRRRQMSVPGATVSSATDEIHKAILSGRNDDAMRLLQEDLSLVGACSVNGTTPLHVAAWAQNIEMIEWLLAHHAPVDAEAPFDVPDGVPRGEVPGKTPLDYAAIAAGWSAHGRHFCFMENSHRDAGCFEDTVRRLRAAGARLTPRAAVATGDANAVQLFHRGGQLDNEVHWIRGGLISIAVRVNRPEMVSLLIDLGLDPDETVFGEDFSKVSWGMPLWFAALCGRYDVAELLLARGADVNAIVCASGDAQCTAELTKDDRMTSLLKKHGGRLTVERVSDQETAKGILEGRIPASSLNVENPSIPELAQQMVVAGARKDPAIVRMCLPHITLPHDDPWWNYVLMHAILPECLKVLLDFGINPDCGDVPGTGGFTLLHHLATDHIDDATRCTKATLLLDAGASLARRDPIVKSTPLGWACRWGRRELAELYLERGADPREADAEPWATPLAWASKENHRDIVVLLHSHGE